MIMCLEGNYNDNNNMNDILELKKKPKKMASIH